MTDTFFAEAGCAGYSRLVRAGFLNDPGFATSGAFEASLGVAIGTETGFFVLGVDDPFAQDGVLDVRKIGKGNGAELSVALGCAIPV